MLLYKVPGVGCFEQRRLAVGWQQHTAMQLQLLSASAGKQATMFKLLELMVSSALAAQP